MTSDIILAARVIKPAGNDYMVPETKNPPKADILRLLEPLRGADEAYAGIEYENDYTLDRPALELQAEKGRYLLLLRDFDEDGKMEVRTFYNQESKGENSMGGEFYSANTIVEDFDLVLRAFCEFAETGNVSRDLMD